MLKKDVKIGMKVVPFQKTADREFKISCWKRAKEAKQPYIYVVGYRMKVEGWALNNDSTRTTGDHFKSEDFNLYIEPNKKEEIKMKGLTLEEQLKDLQEQVVNVQDKITLRKASKKIVEHIATYHVKQASTMTATQFISIDKAEFVTDKQVKNTEYTIDYIRKGDRIICTFTNGAYTGKGMSKCDDEDEFNYFTGAMYAELRARSDFYKNILESQIERVNFKNSIK